MENKNLTVKEILMSYKDLSQEERDKIIKRYMPLAEKIAEKYYDLEVENEDILMSAYEGLIKALETYQEKKNSNLISYLERKIENNVKKEIINLLGFKTIIRDQAYEEINILTEIKILTKKLGRKPTFQEIVNNRKDKSIAKFIFKLESMMENLDASFLMYEKLDTVQNGVLDVENLLAHKELIANLPKIIENSKLTEIEKTIIMNRYIIKEMSIKKLASKLGYSYQYISAKETRIDIRGLSYKRK